MQRNISYTAKRTSVKWARHFNIQVIDPDGWRIDGRKFEDRINLFEFISRCYISTCKYKVGMTSKFDREFLKLRFWFTAFQIKSGRVPAYVIDGLKVLQIDYRQCPADTDFDLTL